MSSSLGAKIKMAAIFFQKILSIFFKNFCPELILHKIECDNPHKTGSRWVPQPLLNPKWYKTSFCDKKWLQKWNKCNSKNFRKIRKMADFDPFFYFFFILDSFKRNLELYLLKIIFCLCLGVSKNVFIFFIPQKMTSQLKRSHFFSKLSNFLEV